MKVLQEITVPQDSVNDQSLIVLELFFKNGDKVIKGSLIAELETSKTTITVEVAHDGYIQYFCQVKDDLEVNSVIAKVFDEVPDLINPAIATEIKKESDFKRHSIEISETVFSKKALELMDEAKISKDVFTGRDFVNADDVNVLINGNVLSRKSIIPAKVGTVVILDDLKKVDLQKVTTYKRKEIEYLNSVQSTGLVSTINTVLELDQVMDYLSLHLRYFKKSILPVILFETSKLLRKFPLLNSYFSGENVALYKDINVGFAVDMGKGLKVLKIQHTDKKSIREIEDEILQLSNDYLDDVIKVDTLSDITFTVTDLSGENVFSFVPLVNMKNSAILGISSIDTKLMRCVLSLAFDHRVTDGKEVASFLSALKERIESYTSGQDLRGRFSHVECYKCLKKLTDDISNTGFAKCITPKGEESYICQSCFKGF